MNRVESPGQKALERMLEADRRAAADARTGTNDGWLAWQRAATDYYVLTHPEAARLRRGDTTVTPSVEEMRERGNAVEEARLGIPGDGRKGRAEDGAERLARVGWFHEQVAGLYGRVEHALNCVRGGDPAGIETLIRFLEADLYCFRSGYVKADAIRFLKRADLDESQLGRLRRIVLTVVEGDDRREFRAFVRLACRVDSPGLRGELGTLAASASPRIARHARWVLVGLAEKDRAARA